MGFYDREYARRPSGRTTPLGAMRLWNVTTWLLAINVAVFVVDRLLGGILTDWGEFSAVSAVFHLQLWRFITFQFLHAGLSHILFNMIALYFFGPMIESYLGARRYLAFYLLCGAGGAALYMLLLVGGILPGGAATALVGASAGIFGILIAAAKIAPDVQVMLLFPPIPMKMKVLALVMLAIALYVVLSNGVNAGGQAAHLGGAAVGALLIWRPESLNLFDRPRTRRRTKRFFMDN